VISTTYLLISSCPGRVSALCPIADEDNEGFQRAWNTLAAAFLRYGRNGKGISGKHQFHSTDCGGAVLKDIGNSP